MIEMLLFVYGAIIGSFLGVVIDRLPTGRSFVFGRSKCDSCKRILSWYELVPIVSFLIQTGRCRKCKKRLSIRYPLYEICTGMIFLGAYLYAASALVTLLPLLVILSSLFVLTVIDLDHMIIPDVLVYIIAGFSLIYHALSGVSFSALLVNNIASGLVSYILFYALWLFTKKRGIGFGDVNLVFALGILTGFPRVVISLYAAFVIGAAVAIILMVLQRKTMKSAVPFGPFLVVGAILSMIVDPRIVFSYFL